MVKEVNKVEISGARMFIYSSIDDTLFSTVNTEYVRSIGFAYLSPEKGNYPNENDARCLNAFFKTHKHIIMDVHKDYWMIPLLPEVERFRLTCYDDEAIELLKNNTIRGLNIYYSAEDAKKDLRALLPFGETLEHLYLDAGQYKPYDKFEEMFNGMKKLKSLEVSSIKIDFSLLNENHTLEDFYYYGSKTKEWGGVAKFTRLKSLRFKNNITLSDIDFLRDLHFLETVDFMYCSKITRFPDLSHLSNLKKIYALECNRVEDIDELKKLNGVDIWVQGKAVPGKWYENRTNPVPPCPA